MVIETTPPSRQDRATASRADHEHLSALIKGQWRRTITIILIATLAQLIPITLVLWGKGHTPDKALLTRLDKSTQSVLTAANALDRGCASPEQKAACAKIVNALEQARIDQAAMIERIEARAEEPSAATLTITQLVGGSAILALLGYLGLARLNNLDEEINRIRIFMFEQIELRTDDLKSTIKHEVMDSVRDEFGARLASFKDTSDEAIERIETLADQIRTASDKALSHVRQSEESLQSKLEQYPWLKNKNMSESLSAISDTPSVQAAHDMAERLRDTDPAASAAMLRVIVEQNLPGDKADFHNAHSEAMRQANPQLGLDIATIGLRSFPDDYDLMSDMAMALLSLGQTERAKTLLEEWRQRAPEQFRRGWRPMVVYLRIIESTVLNEDTINELDATFEEISKQTPYQYKIFGSHARFLMSAGRHARAEVVLVESLRNNPYSQELSYIYGQLLLSQGRSKEAVYQLENAVRTDFQEQFQPDIAQSAVYCMLAQAYEAAGEQERASSIYRSIIQLSPPSTVRRYAEQRLHAISILSGEQPQPSNDAVQLQDLLSMLRQHGTGDQGDIDD